MTPELHQQTVLEHFPFVIEQVDLDLDIGNLILRLRNPQKEDLTLISNNEWQIIVVGRFFDSCFIAEDSDSPYVKQYVADLQKSCNQLLGTS